MSDTVYIQLLNMVCGLLLLTAVLVLWRRELLVIIRVFALQGLALSALVGVLAVHQHSLELGIFTALLVTLRVVVLPRLLFGALRRSGEAARETRPLVNVTASLLAAAGLTLLGYAVSRPLAAFGATPAAQAIPIGITVVLIGFFILVTRRRALSQLVGFLLMDNGITTVAFLTTAGIGLAVELGVSLDVLLAVLVLQVLAARMREAFGDAELDELSGLHD